MILFKTYHHQPFNVRPKLIEYVESVKPKKSRTLAQNSALYLFFTQLSDALNDAGLPMNEMLNVDIDWSPENVKKHLWAVFQEKIYHTKSTTELTKGEQIDKIHETLMRELGEKKGIEFIPFPSKGLDNTKLDYVGRRESGVGYPERVGDDKF